MSGTNDRNLIRIDDLNQPIFRTYSKKWLLPILCTGKDALRNPSTWDDPFENFFLKRTRVEIGSGQFADLENLARDWYGQCWTTNCDTDAMWRIYSANKEGIQVKTTVGKLFDNLKRVPSMAPYLQFFVGRVAYMREAEITAMMGKLTFTDIALGGQADGFADLLCIKREAFQHESEFRILFHDTDQPGRGSNATFLYPLDANVVFEEVVLDPRLENNAAAMLEGELRTAGCRIPIRRSNLYATPK